MLSKAKPTYMRPVLEDAISKGAFTRDARKAARWALVTIDDLTARLAEAEAERDAMRDKMYAADAKAAHAKQQRDSIFRVAKVTKQNADGLRAIIRRCVNELEGWRCALAFRSGQTNAGEERVNKLIEDCLDAAPYTVTPADVFGTGEPKQ